MANEEHLDQLKKGVESWNQWRKINEAIHPDLSGADLREANLNRTNLTNTNLSRANLDNADLCGAYFNSGTDFSGANLSNANLCEAYLSRVNLCNADLSGVYLSGAYLNEAKLSRAKLNGTWLSNAELHRANLSRADLSDADLSDANLSNADLTNTDLSRADLSNANFSKADLSNADLSNALLIGSKLLESNLTAAILTGACIQDWNINSATKSDDVICKYVYLKGGLLRHGWKSPLGNRRPSNPNSIFAPSEFTKLFQKALSTIDLIFRNGVDWEALSLSLNKLRVEAEGVEISVQAIENKDDGTFVVRLKTPLGANNAEIETYIKKEYESNEKLLQMQYQHQLQLKDVEIEGYRRENTNLLKMVDVLGNRPINAIALSGSQSMGDRNINTGGGNYNERIDGNYIQGNYINMSQDLTQAAQQIQDLLQQLQNQGVPVETSQQQVAADMAKQAETNPAMMEKLVLWGKAMANKASETTVSEAAKIVLTLALKAAGVPLP